MSVRLGVLTCTNASAASSGAGAATVVATTVAMAATQARRRDDATAIQATESLISRTSAPGVDPLIALEKPTQEGKMPASRELAPRDSGEPDRGSHPSRNRSLIQHLA